MESAGIVNTGQVSDNFGNSNYTCSAVAFLGNGTSS